MKQEKRSVVLGVTGSIAAYKAGELASLLVKQGHDVSVVMTKDATEFITPLTLQTLSKNPVTTSFYDEKQSWHPGHIALADRADLLLIAPATAHIIAELAHGFAGHPLAAIALATRAPILLAPAMNGKMWDHPATKENVAALARAGSSSSARKPACWPADTKASAASGKSMRSLSAPSSCSHARKI